MVRRRALGLAAFAGAALGGAALGYLAERRLVKTGPPSDDPEWAELATPPAVDHRRIDAYDGTQLHVVTAGPAGAPAIVLVHGYAMSWRFWHYQLRDLADEFRVVAYDLRGHADSEPAASGDYTTTALARDLRAVIDAEVGANPVVVAGHSMGGMTVMALADDFPGFVRDRVAGAALVNTAASKIVYRGLLTALARAVSAAQRLPRRPTRGWPPPGLSPDSDLVHLITRQWSMTRDASPALVWFAEQIAAGCAVDVLAGFGRMMATLDLQAALAHLTVPTLVVVGGRDWLTPARQGRDLAAALAHSRLEVLEATGHLVPLEAPDAFTALLRDHARRCFAAGKAGAA